MCLTLKPLVLGLIILTSYVHERTTVSHMLLACDVSERTLSKICIDGIKLEKFTFMLLYENLQKYQPKHGFERKRSVRSDMQQFPKKIYSAFNNDPISNKVAFNANFSKLFDKVRPKLLRWITFRKFIASLNKRKQSVRIG